MQMDDQGSPKLQMECLNTKGSSPPAEIPAQKFQDVFTNTHFIYP